MATTRPAACHSLPATARVDGGASPAWGKGCGYSVVGKLSRSLRHADAKLMTEMTHGGQDHGQVQSVGGDNSPPRGKNLHHVDTGVATLSPPASIPLYARHAAQHRGL